MCSMFFDFINWIEMLRDELKDREWWDALLYLLV